MRGQMSWFTPFRIFGNLFAVWASDTAAFFQIHANKTTSAFAVDLESERPAEGVWFVF